MAIAQRRLPAAVVTSVGISSKFGHSLLITQPPAHIVLATVPERPGAPLVPANFHGGKTGK